MPDIPNPPPPRSDIPKPDHMTDERYAAYLQYIAEEPPTIFRGTDGTLYLEWMPADMAPPIGMVDSRVAIPPGDKNYRRFVGDLLPHFDYSGLEMPDAARTDADAEA
jgi:hypothetical protein